MNDTIAFDSADRDFGVLVGFDGSDHARSALHFAAAEALSSGAALTVATVYRLPPMMYTGEPAILVTAEARAERDRAEKLLDDAREYLRDYPGEATFSSAEGSPTGVLAELSARAQTVVVGAHGRGGFIGQLLGSVAAALPAHAQCPTVVIPQDYQPGDGPDGEFFTHDRDTAPVVAGIDLSERSRMVLLLAAQQAKQFEVPLRVLTALPLLREWKYWYPDLEEFDTITELRRSNLQASVEKEITWLRRRHARLDISVDVELGDPADLLEAKTRTAQLTVVGTRGRGGMKSTLLGSVSREVLNRARGPVMVVPTGKAGR
ncbi:universal stress protein [Brevibacterium renqingii]|uniref:universal stress protein n=1 Tax=Brevibacterium renqingii TaxID=2776916 RepID=UPI001AE09175|nr:universal stress protein [Brevibacterium renqingii]